MTVWMDKIVETETDKELSVEIASVKAMMHRAPLAFIEAAPDMSYDVVVTRLDTN